MNVITADAVNNFVFIQIERNNKNLVVICRFINQPTQGRKTCEVTVRPACSDNSSFTSEGSISNSNSLMIEFENILEVFSNSCFVLRAKNENKAVVIEGIHNSGNYNN